MIRILDFIITRYVKHEKLLFNNHYFTSVESQLTKETSIPLYNFDLLSSTDSKVLHCHRITIPPFFCWYVSSCSVSGTIVIKLSLLVKKKSHYIKSQNPIFTT